MPCKSHLKSLDAERRILLAESDLNRVYLIRELDRMKEETRALIKPVKTLGSIASTAARIGLVISIWRRVRRFKARPEENSDHHSFFPIVFNLFRGMKTGLSLWRRLRSPRR